MKIAIALSGGVDSSTTAALLKHQGHDVFGIHMQTHRCQGDKSLEDVRRVADYLSIPLVELDFSKIFYQTIILPFARAYKGGLTPNPCVDCNKTIKFGLLLQKAKEFGADLFATGHYVCTREEKDGEIYLCRGRCSQKEQSYFLYKMSKDQLSNILFPLGEFNKEQVRNLAQDFGLPVADKTESQEICFVGSDNYSQLIESIIGSEIKKGNFINSNGLILGKNRGIHRYTIGQRRGLGISSSEPLYVIDINPESGDVVVGPKDRLYTTEVWVKEVNWTYGPPNMKEIVLAQQRYRQKPVQANILKHDDETILLQFLQPQIRGAPGQAAVFYREDKIIGGGRIAKKGP